MSHQGELAGAGEIADLESLAAGHQEGRGGEITFRGYGHEDCILEPAVERGRRRPDCRRRRGSQRRRSDRTRSFIAAPLCASGGCRRAGAIGAGMQRRAQMHRTRSGVPRSADSSGRRRSARGLSPSARGVPQRIPPRQAVQRVRNTQPDGDCGAREVAAEQRLGASPFDPGIWDRIAFRSAWV